MTMRRSNPSAQGVSAGGLLDLLDALETPGHGTHSLMIARHGEVIAEGWWSPYARERVHLGYSLSKSFTATTLGILAGRGAIDLDAPVMSYLAELDAIDPAWRRVTVRHCISMVSGHTAEAWDWRSDDLPLHVGPSDPDPILASIINSRIPDGEPGEVWAYNQVATYLVAQAIAAATGERLTTHLRRLVLDPLGDGPARAQRTPQGRDLGFSGMHLTTPSILALAQTWLDGGRWQGEQLVPQPFAIQAPQPTPASLRADEQGDWAHGYGMSFWGASHGYRADGAFGQYAIVLPEHDLAVAITSEVENMQATLDALWAHLLPAVDAPGDHAADELLGRRLAGLAHRPLAGGSWPSGRTRAVRHGESQLPEAFAAATLETSLTGHHLLELTHPHGALITVVGDGEWLESSWPTRWGPDLAIAASGGWRDGLFTAELRLVETPHCVNVRLDPSDDTVRLDWRLVPLTGADPLNAAGFPF